MVYKFKSAKYIINKLYDMLPTSVEVNEDSILNDIGEAMSRFANTDMFIHKVDYVEIKNYVGELPCDFAILRQISLCGYPVTKSTHTFGAQPTVQSYNNEDDTFYVNGNPYTKDAFVMLMGNSVYSENEYDIRDGFIYTGIEEGYLGISYWAYPLDNEGLPLVPDDELFDTGLKFYCLYMYFMRNWINNDEQAERKMSFFKSEWERMEPKLRARSSSPDLSTVENIKRIWLRPYQRINEFGSFYQANNKHQKLRNGKF